MKYLFALHINPEAGRRSPHGERGLKYPVVDYNLYLSIRRSPHGERGLKFSQGYRVELIPGRSPHGERGLKCYGQTAGVAPQQSLPSRGAWIEITSTKTEI